MSVRLSTEVRKKPLRRATLSTGVAFWVAAMIAFLGFAANAAASPLYRIYQAEFGFSATTLTLLFAVYIVVLLLTLLVLGSVSDYVGRRWVLLAGLASGAVACGLFLRARGWTAVLRPRTARCGRWPHRRRGQRGATRSATK
jgi:MFS family permease